MTIAVTPGRVVRSGMMATTYLITYDLGDRAYEAELLKYVKTAPWCRVAESSYAVHWEATSSQILDEIRRITKDNVTVGIFPIYKPFSSYATKEVNDWLEKFVPEVPRLRGY